MFVIKKFEDGKMFILRGTALGEGAANVHVKIDEIFYSDLLIEYDTISVHKFFCFQMDTDVLKELFGD